MRPANDPQIKQAYCDEGKILKPKRKIGGGPEGVVGSRSSGDARGAEGGSDGRRPEPVGAGRAAVSWGRGMGNV